MCFSFLGVATAVWTPIAGITNTLLWYADSKDVEIAYMAEVRLILGLSVGFPALILAACKYGLI